MANRVLMNASGLKVSKPGVNVLTASPLQLIFNSEWGGMGVVQSGTWNVAWPGGTTKQVSNRVALTKTFSSPPFCAFFMNIPGPALAPLGYGNGFGAAVYDGGGGSGADSRCVLVVNVDATGIDFKAMIYKVENPGLPDVPLSVRYFVFDRTL